MNELSIYDALPSQKKARDLAYFYFRNNVGEILSETEANIFINSLLSMRLDNMFSEIDYEKLIYISQTFKTSAFQKNVEKIFTRIANNYKEKQQLFKRLA